jgi:uncharacterized protein
MTRDEALRRLRAHEAEFRAAGVAALYLFGSTARDEAGPDSDVDLFMDAADVERFNLFDLVKLNRHAKIILQSSVDVLTRHGLKDRVRQFAEHDAVRVF